MTREIIHTDRAPAAVGPYSQAVKAGSLVFTAGQIGLDPVTGQLRTGLEAQTRQVLANLQAVLQAAGTDFSNVVKTTIYLTDMSHFSVVNGIYGQVVGDAPPARSTVAVAALPLDALIEIDVIALVP
ncbi:MAG: RidA family protein [Caldilineae bacterium]|nr:MAG: RidA family protein [Caldilineae bacterium]